MLQENQLKELEQKLNNEASKVKKLESSNQIRTRKVRRIYSEVNEILNEFGLTGPQLLFETDSGNEQLTECQLCFTDFKPAGERVPCKSKLPPEVCPLCVEFWMADKVSFRNLF